MQCGELDSFVVDYQVQEEVAAFVVAFVAKFLCYANEVLPKYEAHMNEDALRLTREEGVAWFWSRSRGRLWKKGESSGHLMKVVELRMDCDQDAVLVRADPQGPACHTGARSCFYRRIDGDRFAPA